MSAVLKPVTFRKTPEWKKRYDHGFIHYISLASDFGKSVNDRINAGESLTDIQINIAEMYADDNGATGRGVS